MAIMMLIMGSNFGKRKSGTIIYHDIFCAAYFYQICLSELQVEESQSKIQVVISVVVLRSGSGNKQVAGITYRYRYRYL